MPLRSVLITLAVLAGACGGNPQTLHAFVISSDVESSGEEFRSALFQSVGATLAPGHTVKRLDNGEVFDVLLAEIEGAKTSIDLIMYIWEEGKASTLVTNAIAARAKAGVACRIVIDSFGSSKFGKQAGPALEKAGCQVLVFRPFPANSVLLRNHRKIAVFDGLSAITGGFGIRDEWIGGGVTKGQWRDTNVLFTGPAVRDAHQAFAENWQEAGGKLLPAKAFPAQPTSGPAHVAFVSSTASPVITRAERLTLLMIAASHKRLWITNAYFVPSSAILDMLKRKAKAGVDIRLLVPGKHDDSKVALIAQRRLYDELGAAGVRVWEYQPTMIHSKTMVVDDLISVVGSINLEPLSLNKLDEAAIVIEDAAFAAGLARSFLDDTSHSKLQTGK